MNIIQQLEQEQAAAVAAKRPVPEFAPGDTVIVNVRVVEGDRTRVQAYEGVVIARSGGGLNENFTVRKIPYGEGVERVFPVYSPMIDFDQGHPPRQGQAGQALLSARADRQIGTHRRKAAGDGAGRGCPGAGYGSHGRGRRQAIAHTDGLFSGRSFVRRPFSFQEMCP